MKTGFKTLPNGLRLAMLPHPGLHSTLCMAGVRAGSRHEMDDQLGAAHFLEHMMFKGTKKRPTSRDISGLVDSRGGYHNASTGPELTSFFLQMAQADSPFTVDVVHDVMANSLLRSSDVKKERLVIQEEIRERASDPHSILWEEVYKRAYRGSPMGRSIAGTVESVRFPPETIRQFRQDHYVPERTVVALAGCLNEKLVRQAEEKFGKLRGKGLVLSPEPSPENRQGGLRYQEAPTERLLLALRFPGLAYGKPGRRAATLMSLILGGYPSARLYQTLREKLGLCYDVGCAEIPHSDCGSFVITAGVEPKNAGVAMVGLLKEIRKIYLRGVTPEELRAAKTFLRGSRSSVLDSPQCVAEYIVHKLLFTGKFGNMNREVDRYTTVTKEEVDAAARDLHMKEIQVTAVGPAALAEPIVKALLAAVDYFS